MSSKPSPGSPKNGTTFLALGADSLSEKRAKGTHASSGKIQIQRNYRNQRSNAAGSTHRRPDAIIAKPPMTAPGNQAQLPYAHSGKL